MQEDVNERIFEASVAAEIVRSLVAVSNADLVTDFVLAEHAVRSDVHNPRYISVY